MSEAVTSAPFVGSPVSVARPVSPARRRQCPQPARRHGRMRQLGRCRFRPSGQGFRDLRRCRAGCVQCTLCGHDEGDFGAQHHRWDPARDAAAACAGASRVSRWPGTPSPRSGRWTCRTSPSSSFSVCSSCSRSSPIAGSPTGASPRTGGIRPGAPGGGRVRPGRLRHGPAARQDPDRARHAVLATLAAVCVAVPRLAETRECPHAALLSHRELIIAVTALVAVDRGLPGGRAVRGHGRRSPCSCPSSWPSAGSGSAQARRAGLAAAGGRCRPETSGSSWPCWARPPVHRHVLRLAHLPAGCDVILVAAFWVGLAATAVLVAFPRPRISVATNVLAGSARSSSSSSSSASLRAPADAVTIGVPFTERVAGRQRRPEHARQRALDADVQRNAIDLVQLVDGKTYRAPQPAGELPHLRAAAARGR